MYIQKLISGGQTGADRAALDAALALGIPIGGFCPRGRLSEDGIIPSKYPLMETPSAEYAQRTEWNVRDSDGTLVLSGRSALGGTAFTLQCAAQLAKPHLACDPTQTPREYCVQWLQQFNIRILNVAGPRESEEPGIYTRAYQFLTSVFSS